MFLTVVGKEDRIIGSLDAINDRVRHLIRGARLQERDRVGRFMVSVVNLERLPIRSKARSDTQRPPRMALPFIFKCDASLLMVGNLRIFCVPRIVRLIAEHSSKRTGIGYFFRLNRINRSSVQERLNCSGLQ